MPDKIRVLVFPAGEINSIELHDALCSSVNIELYGASSMERHGAFIFSKYISGLPIISDPLFIEKFIQVIEELDIDVVFPTHDTVALYLAENRSRLPSHIITADVESARICRDKLKTYELFTDADFCPVVYSTENIVYPAFIKPREGQGSIGARVVNGTRDMPNVGDIDKFVITEYLSGEELTVDCLTDKDGTLRAVLPRTRDRLLAGVSVSGTSVTADEEIMGIAAKINSRLSFLGLWYFQIKKDSCGRFKLLEVSARCAGTMCLSRARGVNLPLLSVYSAMGKEISILENPCGVSVDRTFISRYRLEYSYDRVYLDYDDTLIINGRVCLPVIRFLYQCKNAEIPVILLTRHDVCHSDNIHESLRHFSIAESLFSDIVCLNEDEEKSGYIDGDRAVFIDNAFSERTKVGRRFGIPVFDVDGIEVLTDWRS